MKESLKWGPLVNARKNISITKKYKAVKNATYYAISVGTLPIYNAVAAYKVLG